MLGNSLTYFSWFFFILLCRGFWIVSLFESNRAIVFYILEGIDESHKIETKINPMSAHNL